MADYLVLETSRAVTTPGRGPVELPAGALLSDEQYDIVVLRQQGVPLTVYVPATMADVVDAYRSQAGRPGRDGALLALLIAAGAIGGGGGAGVPLTRQINTTAPLTGGGDLSADRTLAIPAATSAAAGHMTAAQAAKLDGIPANAEPPQRFEAVRGWSAANNYQAAGGTLPGNVAGFRVSVLMRSIAVPTADEFLFAVCEQFLGTGGYFVGINGDRFRFGISQASDGALISNFVSAELPTAAYKVVGRLFLLSMSFDGTDATCRVNGQDVHVLTPASGYQPPAGTITPYFGRNANGGSPLPATASHILGAGYGTAPITKAQDEEHWLACMEDAAFVDDPVGLEGLWSFDGLSSAPAVLPDGIGAVAFTRNGALTLDSLRPRF